MKGEVTMCLAILIFLIVLEIMSFIPNKDDKDEYTGEGYEKRIWHD